MAVSAEQIMSAAPATHAIAKLLDLAPGAPLFCLRRLTRDDSGRPMVLLNSSLRWDRFSYRLSLRQTAGDGVRRWTEPADHAPADAAAAAVATADLIFSF